MIIPRSANCPEKGVTKEQLVERAGKKEEGFSSLSSLPFLAFLSQSMKHFLGSCSLSDRALAVLGIHMRAVPAHLFKDLETSMEIDSEQTNDTRRCSNAGASMHGGWSAGRGDVT